jgi:putative endonuclease
VGDTPNVASTQDKGQHAETLACDYLRDRGLTPVARNYRCRFGEIDLLMKDGDTLVFVEVRFRASRQFGSPAETVDARKQAKLRATAEHYLQSLAGGSTMCCRFDIVSLEGGSTTTMTWLPNAF